MKLTKIFKKRMYKYFNLILENKFILTFARYFKTNIYNFEITISIDAVISTEFFHVQQLTIDRSHIIYPVTFVRVWTRFII